MDNNPPYFVFDLAWRSVGKLGFNKRDYVRLRIYPYEPGQEGKNVVWEYITVPKEQYISPDVPISVSILVFYHVFNTDASEYQTELKWDDDAFEKAASFAFEDIKKMDKANLNIEIKYITLYASNESYSVIAKLIDMLETLWPSTYPIVKEDSDSATKVYYADALEKPVDPELNGNYWNPFVDWVTSKLLVKVQAKHSIPLEEFKVRWWQLPIMEKLPMIKQYEELYREKSFVWDDYWKFVSTVKTADEYPRSERMWPRAKAVEEYLETKESRVTASSAGKRESGSSSSDPENVCPFM